MKKVLVPVAEGFEEIETVTVVDVLRRAGCEVTLAGLKSGPVTGSRRVKLLPDAILEAVKSEPFDMVVLPGGQPGADNLRKDARILDLLRRRDEKKMLIGAICAAPMVLRDAGITAGRTLTSHPTVEKELAEEATYRSDRVVVDGHLVTSRGPGTALEFALAIVELLSGPQKARELEKAMLVLPPKRISKS